MFCLFKNFLKSILILNYIDIECIYDVYIVILMLYKVKFEYYEWFGLDVN